MKSWSGTAEGMGRGTDVSLRWEKAAHALCAQVSAEEMEKMGAGWLAKYLSQPAKLDKFDRTLVEKDRELEVCWATIADLRRQLSRKNMPNR